MITLQKGEIYNPAFGNALTSLSNNKLSFETAYNVKRIVRQIKKNLTDFQTEIQEICKPFAVVKDGVPVPATVFGLVPYEVMEEKKQECSDHLNKFLSEEFSIESHMLSFESLSAITIAPADLLALEKLISEPSAAPQSNVVDFPQQPSPVQ